ncbi:hypothetical protein MNB_SV-3-1111 [hydrothermal vent metagenome]|uniref:Outer membrane protein beta-barrel domain-containing protein n=1 Tax=hydrothermal vent metagenome TaxID=652676 RepID=A0A1W1C840_9ZZZZ
MFKFLILFGLFFTSLFAGQESFPFLGITLSTQTIDTKQTADSSEKETTFALRYGQQTLDWRTIFTIEGDANYKTFSVEIDKILLDELFGSPKFRPYLGATVGYIDYNNEQITKENGVYYGGDFGFIIYASDNIDIDLSFHYYKCSDLEPLERMQGLSLGFNFFY